MNSVKEGQDTQITWITATFEYQQVNVLIYPDLIRPHKAALLKVEIEVFLKILIERPLVLLSAETGTSTEHVLSVQLVT